MAAFAKRARLTSQPVYAAAVDWSNPLTRGLVSALPASAGDIDLVAGRPSDTAGTRVIATNPKGPARKYTSAGARWEIAPSSLESGVTVLSVAVAGSVSSLEMGLAIFSSDDNLYVTYETGAFRLFRRNGGGFPGASFTQTLEAGRTYVVGGIQRSAALRELWVDGVLRATNTTNVTRSSVFYRSGTNYGETGAQSAGSFPATYEGPALNLVWNRALSETEMAEVSANPWQLFAPRRIWVPVAGGGGGGNTIAVPAGALTLSGFAPTVTATANQRVDVPAGSLSLSAFAPVVTSTVRIVVPAGTLNLTALAPTVTATANNRIAPPAGTLTLTAYAPTVAAGATQTISVPAGSLTLTGFAPTVTATQNQNISVPTGALVLTGFAPNVSGVVQTIAVPSGTLVLAAFAPAVSNGAEEFTSSAVFYVPLRMVSGLWSTTGVSASIPADKQAWLPPIRQPIAYVDQRDGRTYCDPAWYRAFEFVFETRLGGRLGPSIPDVVSTVAATQETAAAASATIAEVAQQTQANAEALFVVREVVQGGALDGADQIPGVDLR